MMAKKEYGSHPDYMARVEPQAKARVQQVERALREAFAAAIHREEVDVIVFSDMNPQTLGAAIFRFPAVLKPLFIACNIAARAVERDIQIKNLDTYKPRLTRDQALIIATFIKPHLPPMIPLSGLSYLDRVEFIDKEIRKNKGRWEKDILTALNLLSLEEFGKRQFESEGESYELDAAVPPRGEGPVRYAVDIKRIEARRDIHKRCDEIVNKAEHLKGAFRTAKFGAVIYYPFITEHTNVQDRLRSDNIDSIVFAAEDEETITNAVNLLLAKFGIRKP
jgi:hypothetical protein